MKKLSFVVLCFFLCCLTGFADTLVLKETAMVSDNIVRIKDIALMDAPTRSRIGNLVIAVAPEMGASDKIGKQEVFEKLVGNGVKSPQIKGAATVKVVRKGTVVKPTYFRDMIRQYISTHSKWQDGITVEMVTKKDIIVPQSRVRWQLTPANGQDFFGNILFKVRAFTSTNEEVYSNWIVAKLKIVKPVAVSNRMIQKNEVIGSGDIRWETREITAFTRDALFNGQEIVGQKAGRIIRPNSVITSSLMEKKYMVRRGGTATLVAHLKSVKATSTVKVLSNGGLGDNVRVMNIRSKRILSAIVTGKNRLEVNVE